MSKQHRYECPNSKCKSAKLIAIGQDPKNKNRSGEPQFIYRCPVCGWSRRDIARASTSPLSGERIGLGHPSLAVGRLGRGIGSRPGQRNITGATVGARRSHHPLAWRASPRGLGRGSDQMD